MDQPIHKLPRRVSVNRRLATSRFVRLQLPLHHVVLGPRHLRHRPRHGQQHRPGHNQQVRVLETERHKGGDGDFLDLGNVAERNVALANGKLGGTAGRAAGTVGEVRGVALPGAQALRGFLFGRSRGCVDVGQGHEVRGHDGAEGFLETRHVEGAGNEVAGDRVGGGRGLDGVEGTTVVLGGVVLVSVRYEVRHGG